MNRHSQEKTHSAIQRRATPVRLGRVFALSSMLLVTLWLNSDADGASSLGGTSVHHLFFVPIALAAVIYRISISGAFAFLTILLAGWEFHLSDQAGFWQNSSGQLMDLGLMAAVWGVVAIPRRLRQRKVRDSSGRIHELKREVAELVAETQRLSQLERVQDWQSVSAGLADRFRKPLKTIKSNVQTILRAADLAKLDKSCTVAVIRAIDTLDTLIAEYSTAAEPETTKLLDRSVNELVAEVLKVTGRVAVKAGVEVIAHYGEALPAIPCDSRKMGHAIEGILRNAIDATGSGGTVTVRTSVVLDRIHIEVEDEGPGIPKERMREIFEPFFSTRQGRNGLGLSVCKSVVKAHGGNIAVSNNRTRGATFKLMLPIHAHRARAAQTTRRDKTEHRARRDDARQTSA